MNLAIVIEQFDPHAGGAERSTAQIASELVQRGHAVTVLAGWAPSEGTDLDMPGLTVRSFGRRRASSVLRLLGFRRWASQQLIGGGTEAGFDTSLSVTMAVPAAVVQPRGGTVRETLERNVAMRPKASSRLIKRLSLRLDPKQQALLAMERQTLVSPRVRKVVAVSGYVVDQLQRHYQVDASRIELIPNAAVMPQASDEQKQTWRQQIRQGFGVPDEATLYLFAAQNPRLKGFAPLMEATRRLVEHGQHPVVLLAGEFGYAPQAHAAALGVREHVRFVGQTRQIHALYAAADVTVLPSFYDPASKVVIESLMMGTPAISTACNGASDFITPNGGPVRGRVIGDPADPATTEALAQAMSELADPAEREACRAATAGLAEELSMTRHVDRLEQVLAESGQEEGQTRRGTDKERETV